VSTSQPCSIDVAEVELAWRHALLPDVSDLSSDIAVFAPDIWRRLFSL